MPFHRAIPEQKRPAKGAGGLGAYVEAEKLMQIAFVMPAAVAIGWVAGWWLSGLLHQKWMEIAGVVFGCISGLYYVIQVAIAAEKKTSLEDEDQNGAGKGTPT
jgi:uncharacterized membrane protein YfcA